MQSLLLLSMQLKLVFALLSLIEVYINLLAV